LQGVLSIPRSGDTKYGFPKQAPLLNYNLDNDFLVNADPKSTPNNVEWIIDDAPIDYQRALSVMEERVTAIHAGAGPECVWLLEHPSLYTAGASAQKSDLIDPDRFPVHTTGRGGQYTYHGPGQRIGYVMLNLQRRTPDVRRYVHDLEEWIIRTLASFNVTGERREGRVGIWVDRGGGREDKIAAIGVRIRHWITFHGIAINVEPDLEHFSGIVPCGIGDEKLGVTSLVDLGLPVTMADLDVALMAAFDEVFES
jgi:lipoyl(octanoyl) transferase